MSNEFVTLAVVTSPHGVSGRVKVKSFASPPELFGQTKKLQDESGNPVKLKITSGEGTVFVCSIDGLKKREDAELWRNKKLGVMRTDLPDTRKKGEFYIADLVGAKVQTGNGDAFGTVKNVYNFGAGDILEIAMKDGSDEMFSFNQTIFTTIDAANKRLVIDPPEVITGKDDE